MKGPIVEGDGSWSYKETMAVVFNASEEERSGQRYERAKDQIHVCLFPWMQITLPLVADGTKAYDLQVDSDKKRWRKSCKYPFLRFLMFASGTDTTRTVAPRLRTVDPIVYMYAIIATATMELSAQVGGTHAVASPSGQYIAFLSIGKLRIYATQAPERCTEVQIRIQPKDVAAVRWNDDSTRICILSARHIEIIDLDDAGHRVRVDNGSGGLGRFVSADFVGSDKVLVIWEFGKAKLWDLSSGKGVEIGDVKTACSSERWRMRPGNDNAARRSLATLSRPGADDLLNLYFPAIQKQLSSVKLFTTDAQSLFWSPDGRWIAVLDAPTASPSVHFYTPDGHYFRSYPPASDTAPSALGAKHLVWSSNSRLIALTKYDGKIALLNTRTFTLLAVIEHTTTIDQRFLHLDHQAPIWQETVSASGERSYSGAAQPVSPPLSRAKPSTEPSELGVAEARFSCDGSYLATRDERMLNTVWIWNMATLAAHAVLIQHSDVKRLHWHPECTESLMVDSGEGIVYLFHATSSQAPIPLPTSTSATSASWICTSSESKSVLLATTKSSFRLVYPEGRTEGSEPTQAQRASEPVDDEPFEEGASEDSLFDVLSGRKAMPRKMEESYTERVDLEVETEDEDMTTRIDDTFREKRTKRPVPIDPLDDSQIF